MPAELFDLFWRHVEPPPERARVGLTMNNRLRIPPAVPALILYPALMTPGIVGGENPRLELLLAIRARDTLRPVHVNRQLKVFRGLNPERRYKPEPLFQGLGRNDERIRIGAPVDLADEIVASHRTFAGILDRRAVALFRGAGFGLVVPVSVDPAALDAAAGPGAAAMQNARDPGGYLVAPEDALVQDHLVGNAVVQEAIESEPSRRRRLPRDGRYGFPIRGRDVRVGPLDKDALVQSYHPVFKADSLQWASIGHLSDVHISSRQQILAKSRARVIEYPDDADLKPIGDLVNICSRDTKQVLDALRDDADVDVVVVGGDLVDFINNVHRNDMHTRDWKASHIWSAMNMEQRRWYRDNVDFLSIYSMLLEHYRANPTKPVYGVTGNHDAYYQPYGISPRIRALGTERKANEGIPADHNLTIYEAILAFGPTYGTLLTVPRSSFTAAKLAWFYSVFTPFKDFAMTLPKQVLVGLGWGDAETMISLSRPGGQGVGHLPWADDPVTDRQLALVRRAIRDRGSRKLILTTHFTFVSYAEAITNQRAARSDWGDENDQGDVYYTAAWYSTRNHSLADMGTFRTHREEMYAGILAGDRRVQLVLTGHSHRRGFYTMRRLDLTGNNSVKTGFSDFPRFRGDGTPDLPNEEDRQEPYVILSDSGGSIPRRSHRGEFRGWGSDPPAGTRIRMDGSGNIRDVTAIRTSVRPRFVVALDYMDVMGDPVITRFETSEVLIEHQTRAGFSFVVNLEFADEIMGRGGEQVYGLSVDSVRLYWRNADTADPRAGEWRRIALEPAGATKWRIPAGDTWMLRDHLWRERRRLIFAAIKFSSTARNLQRYDFSTPWTFEVRVERDTSGGIPIVGTPTRVKYILHRDEGRREVPDFATRVRHWDYDNI